LSHFDLSVKSTKTHLAKELGIARSSLYYRHKQSANDWQLKVELENTLSQKPYHSYGHKRLARHLKINKKRVLRVMKLFGIKPYRRRGKKPFKKPGKPSINYSNLLLKMFPSKPNQIWASDFTYLKFKGKFIYLATIMDIFTREIIGFSVSNRHGVPLVVNALLSALNLRAPPEILHSDQGREYTSKTYTTFISMFKIFISMSRRACPWENGYQESFYSQFKVDLGDPDRFDNLGELVAEIHDTVKIYNHDRIHTSLKMPPRQFAQLNAILNSSTNSGYQVTEKVS